MKIHAQKDSRWSNDRKNDRRGEVTGGEIFGGASSGDTRADIAG